MLLYKIYYLKYQIIFDIEIELKYWACVIKYINTTANFFNLKNM